MLIAIKEEIDNNTTILVDFKTDFMNRQIIYTENKKKQALTDTLNQMDLFMFIADSI